MANENENLDSSNEAADQGAEENLETTDDVDALKEKNRKLFERAKSAETELKKFKTQPKETPASKSEPDEKAPGAPRASEEGSDYAERFDKMTMRIAGITDSEQQAEVLKSSKSLGVPVEEALENEYLQAKLKSMKEGQKTQEAVPEGSKRSSTSPRNEVDYWITKDELPEDNPELRRKVVLEKVKRSKSSQGLPLYR